MNVLWNHFKCIIITTYTMIVFHGIIFFRVRDLLIRPYFLCYHNYLFLYPHYTLFIHSDTNRIH